MRQCFKTHKKNQSGFATNVKLCILSLSSLLLFYKEARQAPEFKQTAIQISGGSQVSWGSQKEKRKTKKAVCYLSDVQRPWRPCMPVAGLFTLFQSCTQQTKPGRLDWFRKRRENSSKDVSIETWPPSSLLHTLLLSGLPHWTSDWVITVGQRGTYLPEHVLMPSYMAKAFLSQHLPCQPCSMPLGRCCWCGGCNGRPDREEELCMSSLVLSHKKQECSQAQLPWLCS